MKKHLLLLLAVAAGASGLFAKEGTCGENVNWKLSSDGTKLTISGFGPMTDYSMTDHAPWFSDNHTIQTVEVQADVHNVGDYAFFACGKLTSVSLANSVSKIGNGAFASCDHLSSITFPNALKTIGDGAFLGCEGLTSVTLPETVTSVGSGIFSYCKNITAPVYNSRFFVFLPLSWSEAYSVPDGIEQIATIAFYQCSNLPSVVLPESVTSIGGSAFSYCTNLAFIVCKAQEPPALGEAVISKLGASVVVYVPDEKVNTYKAAEQWQDLGDRIKPISAMTTGVDQVPSDQAPSTKVIENGVLYIMYKGVKYNVLGQIEN